jgi:hypothetical protein
MIDYALPGSVIALKFLFRLSVGQEVKKVDLFKAILNFPVDLAFLAVSFAAIILPYMQSRPVNPISTKEVMLWFALYIVAAFVVTIFTKSSDKAFVLEKNGVAFLFSLPAYFLSILVITLSLKAIG